MLKQQDREMSMWQERDLKKRWRKILEEKDFELFKEQREEQKRMKKRKECKKERKM